MIGVQLADSLPDGRPVATHTVLHGAYFHLQTAPVQCEFHGLALAMAKPWAKALIPWYQGASVNPIQPQRVISNYA